MAMMNKIAKMYIIKIKIQNEKEQMTDSNFLITDFYNAINFLDQEINKLNQQIQVSYQNENDVKIV